MELLKRTSDSVEHCMPLIFWHDRKPILSVHVQPVPTSALSSDPNLISTFKVATASVQDEVRVWEVLVPTRSAGHGMQVKVNFMANLEEHRSPLNFAKFSPCGEFRHAFSAFFW